MNREEVLERVLAFLGERFPEQRENLAPSTDLNRSVLLDSLAVMEILMFIEKDFGLSLDRADLDAFDSPQNIAELILHKQPA